ncbi:MAG: secondary thiamine-phosphate synthase enzyme YjbQ [Dehalococcoidia bacterium]
MAVVPIERFEVPTEAREQLRDITGEVNGALARLGVSSGICQVFVPHTTAGLVVNENADPAVCHDVLTWLASVVPQDGGYLHEEGNSAAHIKATLVGQSVTLPIQTGRLAVGTWQGVFLAEFDGPRRRTVVVNVVGS